MGTFRSDGQRIKCKELSKASLEEFLDDISADRGIWSESENWNVYLSAHQMGSCRMGATEKEGAVDDNGESWEVEGVCV